MDRNRFFPHPRAYSGLRELCAKEIYKWTGVSNARLVVLDEGRFCFKERNDPDNQAFQRFIGIVDPHSDINLHDTTSSIIFYTDDDQYAGKIIIVATDGSRGLSVDLFYQLAAFYNL